MIRIGTGNEVRKVGLKIIPPSGYNVLWVRIPNHVYQTFRLGLVNETGADY